METAGQEIRKEAERRIDTAAGQAERPAGLMKEQRERRFEELGIEEKISRIRDAVMSLAATSERAASQAEEANRIARVHDHGSGGQVVVPIDEHRNQALSYMGDVERPFRRIQRLLG